MLTVMHLSTGQGNAHFGTDATNWSRALLQLKEEKNMKKFWQLAATGVLAISMLAACGDEAQSNEQQESAQKEESAAGAFPVTVERCITVNMDQFNAPF